VEGHRGNMRQPGCCDMSRWSNRYCSRSCFGIILVHRGQTPASSQQSSNQSVQRMGDITDTLLQYCKDYSTDPKRTQPDCSWLQVIATSPSDAPDAFFCGVGCNAKVCLDVLLLHQSAQDGSWRFHAFSAWEYIGWSSISRQAHQPEMLFYSSMGPWHSIRMCKTMVSSCNICNCIY